MKINWRQVCVSLALGTIGGLVVSSLVSVLGGSNNSEVLATWFSAIGTVAAVIVSLITSRGAMKIAKYTGMYEARLNEQIQELLTKIDSLIDHDEIGPKAYSEYTYEPFHIPSPTPAEGEEGKNMERLDRAFAFQRDLAADMRELRQYLAAIRMLNNGHLDRETITDDMEIVDGVVAEFNNFEQKMVARNLNPYHYRHMGTYTWQRHAGIALQKVFDDFKLLRMDD